MVNVVATNRAHPDWQDPDFVEEKAQEFGRVFDRNVYILYHALRMPIEQLVDGGRQADPIVPAHDLLIGNRVQPAPPEQQPHRQVLYENVFRAPEPVGIPAPDVVTHTEEVLLALADRAKVHLEPGVIAGVGGVVDAAAERQVHLVCAENRAVDKIGVTPAGLADRGEILVSGTVSDMTQFDARFYRHGAGGELEDIAQRAVRIRNAIEQVGVFIIRAAGNHLAVG